MRLRLKPAFVHGYHGPSGSWRPGGERDVDDAEAARLLRHFGDRFEAVAAADGASPPDAAAPPARRTKPAAPGVVK